MKELVNMVVYSVHADCDTEYFLPGNGLAYALWMDGTG